LLELLFGMVMGYVLNAFLMSVFTSGSLIDMQMGFGMVNVFDVQANISVPIMGNWLNLALLMIFFAVNGHLRLIEMLHLTFMRVPIGHIALDVNIAQVALNVFVRSFILAVSVAMPIVASGLVLEVSLGIIVRTVPQMNVFVVGFPIKIMVGFIVLMVCIPVFVGLSSEIFNEMFDFIDELFRGFRFSDGQ
jgi:flagellar biosynthetic protein FliR